MIGFPPNQSLSGIVGGVGNDERKTKKQLLEDLELERERSNALQDVSNKLASAHDTAEVLDLIVNRKRPVLH